MKRTKRRRIRRMNSMTLKGRNLPLKDYLKVHKIILSYKEPIIFYKILIPYLIVSGALGALLGWIV